MDSLRRFIRDAKGTLRVAMTQTTTIDIDQREKAVVTGIMTALSASALALGVQDTFGLGELQTVLVAAAIALLVGLLTVWFAQNRR